MRSNLLIPLEKLPHTPEEADQFREACGKLTSEYVLDIQRAVVKLLASEEKEKRIVHAENVLMTLQNFAAKENVSTIEVAEWIESLDHEYSELLIRIVKIHKLQKSGDYDAVQKLMREHRKCTACAIAITGNENERATSQTEIHSNDDDADIHTAGSTTVSDPESVLP